jgi:hypothetical protein
MFFYFKCHVKERDRAVKEKIQQALRSTNDEKKSEFDDVGSATGSSGVKGQAAAHRRRAKLDAEEEAALARVRANRPHHDDHDRGGGGGGGGNPVRKGRTANMSAAEIQKMRQSIDVKMTIIQYMFF